MGTYRGTLSTIEIGTIKSGKNTGQEYRRIGVGKSHFSVFDAKEFPKLLEWKDKEVEVEYKERANETNPANPYRDFVSIKLATPEAAKPPASNGHGYGKAPEEVAAERASIESQTAYKGIVELLTAKVIDLGDPRAKATGLGLGQTEQEG